MSELKPCPFCGGEADVMLSQSRWGQSYTIHHDALGKCPAEYVGSMQFATEAEAIDAWNIRAERTCEFVSSKGSDYPPICSACGYELGIYDCEWFDDGTYGYERNYCPNCGAKVVVE